MPTALDIAASVRKDLSGLPQYNLTTSLSDSLKT
jgi:hypothetical protein